MKTEKLPIVNIYSDGGANPNPGPGGYGIVLEYKGIKKEFKKGFKKTTNNRMELSGAINGLQKLKIKSKVTINTDSQYTINGIEKGWAKKWKENNWYRTKNQKAQNYDLWEKLLKEVSKHEVSFNWIKGHSGHIENERCDELATQAMQENNLIDDLGFKEDNQTALEIETTKLINKKNKNKIEKSGDICGKCNTPVEKMIPKKKSKSKNFYYKYYFHCTGCKTNYFTQEAKTEIK